ncbi:MAG: hypothetical protein ACRDIE_17860 [Chloroflexota bacterium]
MDSIFARAIEQWHDFYMMAGTAGATLIGLLFVSVSLHVDLITDPASAAVLAAARRAFSNFILLLLIALMFLIPGQTPHGLGIPLVVFGFYDLVRTVRTVGTLRRERAHLTDLLGSAMDLGRTGIALAGSIGLLVVSVTILSGSTQYLDWLVAVVCSLLVGAADNCWSLLLDLAVAKRHLATPHVAGAPATAEA